MNDTSLTPQKAFEEKVKDRIRESIGDLMPDELLSKMTERAMEEMFFQDRKVKTNSFHNDEIIKPSWFKEEVETLLRTRINGFLDKWFEEQAGDLAQKFTDELIRGAPDLMVTYVQGVLAKSIEHSSGMAIDLARQSLIKSMNDQGISVY